MTALRLGDHAKAKALLEEQLALCRELGDGTGINACLSRLADL